MPSRRCTVLALSTRSEIYSYRSSLASQEDFVVDFGRTKWQVFLFYTGAAATMAFAMLNLVISGFLVVGAQGLTLRGPPNSVARCVEILAQFWPLVKWSLLASVLCLLTTATSICWMKLENVDFYPATAIWCTAIVAGVLLMAFYKMTTMYRELAIPSDDLVRGDLNIGTVQPLVAPSTSTAPRPKAGAAPAAAAGQSVDLVSEDRPVIPVSR